MGLIKTAEVLIDAGLVQGFFLAFLILYKKKNNRANRILAGLLVVFSIGIAHASFAGAHLRTIVRTPLEIKEPFVMLVAPLLWMYVDSIAGKRTMSWSKTLVHYLPFVVFTLLTLPFLVHRHDITPNHVLFRNASLITFIAWCCIIGQFSVYLFKIQHLVRRHSQKAAEELSNTEEVSLQWVRTCMFTFVLFYALVLFATFAQLHLPGLRYFSYAVGLLYTFSVFLIGYRGLFQKDLSVLVVENQTPATTPKVTKEKTMIAKANPVPEPASNAPEKAMFEKLLQYMEEHKPYLNAELSLTELARQLDLSRNQLSYLINTYKNENFYTFVNTYRVDEVKQLFASPKHQHYTILTLAYEAGFSSKSSFNRIFKSITGSTPSEYQKKQP